MRRFATLFLTGALALSLASTVHAKDNLSVEFEAALLDTPAGAEEVYHRMAWAARQACVDSGLVGRYPGLVQSCRDEVLDDLIRNTKSPALIALHTDGQDRAPAARKFANVSSH